jgi:hypothetical protein
MNFNCHVGIGRRTTSRGATRRGNRLDGEGTRSPPECPLDLSPAGAGLRRRGAGVRCGGWLRSAPPGLPGQPAQRYAQPCSIPRLAERICGARSGRTSGQLAGEEDLAASEAPTSCECRAAAPNPTPNCLAHPVRRQRPLLAARLLARRRDVGVATDRPMPSAGLSSVLNMHRQETDAIVHKATATVHRSNFHRCVGTMRGSKST